jgi:hypothetical protein
LDKPRKSIDLPWPAIAAALVAVGGVFLYLNPLQTSRPTQAGFPVRFNRDLQDVEARLWQDPLRTTAEHETQVQSQKDVSVENSLHVVEALRERLRSPDSSSSLVLAVMIQGGSYAEYSESRLRMRQAVLEALGAQSYVPRDGEHIGYFKIDKPEWDWRSMIVPFEWCERNVHKVVANSCSFGLPDRICVLWLRDEEFQDQPLTRLDWLLCNSNSLGVETANVKTRVIGPRTSTTLLAMMHEVADDEQSLDRLPNVEMWCATATASDELLLHEINQPENQTIEEYFTEKMGSAENNECFIFHRCTPTDRDVINTLADELRTKRGLKLNHDHIALISEWDTFYGRALPITFECEVSAKSLDKLLHGQHPKNILIYHYLRGIDGMLPGTSVTGDFKTEEKKKQTEENKQSSLAREMTEGLNQADYLRRLARELVNRNEEFRRKEKREIKAVGVLGSDVYDKLLVMEALRDSLPNAIFFTNQLDARLAHPDEWRWTRNLLVGSPFGLTLREEYQVPRCNTRVTGKTKTPIQDVPPFRESDQTAFYTATLLAAGHPARADFLKSRDVLRPVRLYEIGRKGAFDLTPRSTNPKTLQPENFDMERWWKPWRRNFTLLIGFFAMAAMAWSLRVIVGNPNLSRDLKRYRRERLAGLPSSRTTWLRRALVVTRWRFFRADRSVARALSSSWDMFVILGLCSIVVVWTISCYNALEGEPYSWSDGISIWPTETLRLFAALLSAFYLWKINKALWESERRVECNFALPKYSHSLARLSPEKSWWRRVISAVTVRHWKCDKDHTIDASLLWMCYCDSGAQRARWLRIAPLIICFIGAASCLLFLLGAPGVPARGDWARNWDRIFLVLAIVGSVSVTFYVADVTLLCRRFIHYLMKDVTTWPPGALTNLRGRWSRSKGDTVAAKGEVPPNDLLREYLDIDFIARGTDFVGRLIYYPFILISLLIISRLGVFDHWTWPVALLIIVGFNAGYAAFSVIYLRRTAERARQRSLKRLHDMLISYTAIGESEGKEAKTIREATTLIQNEDRGAFAAISQQPLAAALLLPSGSAGIWALLQFFPRLFSS